MFRPSCISVQFPGRLDRRILIAINSLLGEGTMPAAYSADIRGSK